MQKNQQSLNEKEDQGKNIHRLQTMDAGKRQVFYE